MSVFTRSVNFLPEYYRTTANKKFLAATMDQLMQPAQTERLHGYIGRKVSDLFDPTTDVYVKEKTQRRQAYQLENATVIRNDAGNVTFLNTYEDLLDLLSFYGADTNLQNLLFEDPYLVFDSKVDLDKLVNYHEYYWLSTGPLTLSMDDVDVNDIIGAKTYSYTQEDSTEFDLSNGMLIEFGPNTYPDSYRSITYVVEGVGTAIQLIEWRSLITPELFVTNLSESYDSNLYDQYTYDQETAIGGGLVTNTPVDKDYIVQQRGTLDNNPWSRTNRWFHKDVIIKAYELNGQVAVLDQDLQAKRPVIEFNRNLKLYNFGNVFKKPIDLIDSTTTDVFSHINGLAYGSSIDGVVLQNGYRVIFTADTDADVRNKTYEVEVVTIDEGTGVIDNYTGDGATTDYYLYATPKSDSLLVTVDGRGQQIGRDFTYTSVTLESGATVGLISFITAPADGSDIELVELILDRKLYIKPADDFEPVTNQVLLVLRGNTNQAINYYYDGAEWVLAQNKTDINVSPLFELFDRNGNSFGDQSVYPASSFEGTKLFSYKLGSTVNDSELGLPITYRNFSTVGDILFEVNYQTESFNYTPRALPVTKQLRTGYVGILQNDGTLAYEGNYVSAIDKNVTYAQKLFLAGSRTNDFDLDYLLDTADYLPNVRVFVNGEKIDPSLWSIELVGIKKKLRFVTDLVSTDLVLLEIKTRDRVQNDLVYEPTKLWTNNPFNDDLGLITLGQFTQNLGNLADNITGVVGVTPGYSNLRDLGKINLYDRQFIANESNLHLASYMLSENGGMFMQAIDWLKNEYQAFKNQFVNELVNLSDPNLNTLDLVDAVLQSIGERYNNLPQFRHSDMCPWGTNFTEKTYTVIDPRDKIYYLDQVYIDSVDNERAVIVYLNGTQQIKNVDYTFDSNSPTFKFTDSTSLTSGDTILVREYDSTANSAVPPTPSKLGLYPKFRPEIRTDDTYLEVQTVIVGHDGSYTPIYGDYRDDAILELETRIYNSIKVDYHHDKVDAIAIQPGYYRTDGWSLAEFNSIISTDFIQWAVNNNVDYSTNSTFTNSNPFTYNYGIVKNRAGTGKLPGYYREIYRYFYDTTTPNLTPWEMLGITDKPEWWEDEYGPSPYTSQNTKLWQDLSEGRIRQGRRAGIDLNYARNELLTSIPVDEHGELLDPINCQLTGTIPPSKLDRAWVFGDGSPAEYAWRRSSEWPYVVQKAMAVLKAGRYFGLFYDNSRLALGPSNFWLNTESDTLTKPSDILCPYDLDATGSVIKTAGYLNIVAEYMQAFNKDVSATLANDLPRLSTSLVYRVGGYTKLDSFKLQISAYSPSSVNQTAFVPTANLDLVLHKSAPQYRIDYSGVIVERTTTGYKVSGYDTSYPYFRILPSVINANKKSVSFNTRDEVFLIWQSNISLKKDDIVRYGENYYRARRDLVTGTSFASEDFNKLPDLPRTAGVGVIHYNDYQKKIVTVPYNKEYTTIQEVYDFIISYSRYLESVGFVFDTADEDGLVVNWSKMATDFIEWSQQGWQPGVVITLSPAAKKLYLENVSGTLENIYDITAGTKLITDQNNQVLTTKDLSVMRLGSTVEIEASSNSNGIFKFKGVTVNYEHAVVIDNVTEFNDLIYDPAYGYKQDRLRALGFRTGNWTGRLEAPGYLIDLAIINDWQEFFEYKIGDVVKYKTTNYVSKKNHVSTDEFEFSYWELITQDIIPGIVPNADSKAKLFSQLYEPGIQPFVETQQLAARHLIGYQRRDYLENILIDDTSQFQFYQGFIKEKGTKAALTKLGRNAIESTGGNLNVYQEWMVRSGEFGGTEKTSYIDINLNEEDFIYNRVGIQLRTLASDNPSLNVVEVIKGDGQLIKFDNNYATDYFLQRKQDAGVKNLFKYNTAGYPRLDEVTYTVYNESDIDNLTADQLAGFEVGTTVWVGFSDNNYWDVLRLTETRCSIVSVDVDSTDGDIIVTTEPAHNVEKDQRIVIKRFQPADTASTVNPTGFYTVLSVISSNKFKISSLGQSVTELTLGDGTLLKWNSSRFGDLRSLLAYTPPGGWLPGDKAWLDKAYSNYATTFTTDGSTVEFILDSTAIGFEYTSDDVTVKLQGVTLTPGTDYTIESGILTTEDVLDGGQELYVSIDAAGDLWRVYERTAPWNLTNIVQSKPVTGYNGYGASCVVTDLTAGVKTMFVGVPGDDRGKVFIVDAINYEQREMLTPTIVDSDADQFGASIAVQPNGQVLVIGAPNTVSESSPSDRSGAVYIALKNQYDAYALSQELRLPTSDDAQFGFAVDISTDGQFIFVSEPLRDTVYVYEMIESAEYWEPLTSYTLSSMDLAHFGHCIKYDTVNSQLYVGAPYWNDALVQQGAVFVFDFDGSDLTLDQRIDAPTAEQNELFGFSIDQSVSTGKLIIGAPGAVDGDLSAVGAGYLYNYNGTGTAEFTNKLVTPYNQAYSKFGYKVSITDDGETAVISSTTVDRPVITSFDNGLTTFDSTQTVFRDVVAAGGQAHTFSLLLDQWLWEQEISIPQSHIRAELGSSLFFDKDLTLYVGAPYSDINDDDAGAMFVFNRNSANSKAWTMIHQEQDLIDPDYLNKALIYDINTGTATSYVNFYDPVKGLFELDYFADVDIIQGYDPAYYSTDLVQEEDVIATNFDVWYREHVGAMWVNTGSFKYIWYEQGDNDYRINNWGQLFPESNPEVCEWVESLYAPSDWAAFEAPGKGGVPKYSSNTAYNTKIINGTQYYYYWVVNKLTLEGSSVKSYSAYDLQQVILGNEAKKFAVVNTDTMALINFENSFTDRDSVLQVSKKLNIKDIPAHIEWTILREGLAGDEPSTLIKNKILDSLTGRDLDDNPVPNVALPVYMQTGISYRPKQNMFVDRVKALRAVQTFINENLIKYRINSDSYDFALLNSKEAEPLEAVVEFRGFDNSTTTFDRLTTKFYDSVSNYDERVLTKEELGLIETDYIVDGYKVLVAADEDISGLWAVYIWDKARGEFLRVQNQSYDSTRYWNYTDWYAEDFDRTRLPNIYVTSALARQSLVNVAEEALIKQTDASGWKLYLRQSDEDVLVGEQNGTIQISLLTIIGNSEKLTGFDYASFDSNTFDLAPVLEMRYILRGILEDVFSKDLELLANQYYFILFRYILSEQTNVDWLLKTSFITLTNSELSLDQRKTYTPVRTQSTLDYVNEVKPFHTKVRESLDVYTPLTEYKVSATDFDNPPVRNADNTISINDPAVGSTYYETYPGKWYYDNYRRTIRSITVIDGGSSYTNPTITATNGGHRNSKFKAQVIGGQIVAVEVIFGGNGCICQPEIVITDSTGSGARLYAVLEGRIRDTAITIKFDRIKESNDLLEVDGTEDWSSTDYHAADRIQHLYNPVTGMPGKDFGQLMQGVDFPGVQVQGLKFDRGPGWEGSSMGWDTEPWDNWDLDAAGIPTPGVDIIDQTLTGTSFSSATGLSPTDVITDGEHFVSAYHGHAPEEKLQGQIFDTLDIKVYGAPGQGSSSIWLDTYIGDGATTDFRFKNQPVHRHGLKVYVDDVIQIESQDYTVDFIEQQVKFSPLHTPASNSVISVYSMTLSGLRIQSINTFITDGETRSFLVPHASPEYDVAVFRNGGEFATSSYTVTDSDEGKTVTIVNPPVAGSLLTIVIVDDTSTGGQGYSRPREAQIPITNASVKTYTLNFPPAVKGPASANIFVYKNDQLLTPPDTTYYVTSADTYEYAIGQNPAVADLELVYPDIAVYLNGEQLNLGIDFVVDFDAQTVLLNTTVQTDSDLLAITVKRNCDFFVEGNQITFLCALSTSDEIYYHTFQNHDDQGIRTEVFAGTGSATLSIEQGFDSLAFDAEGFAESLDIVTTGQIRLSRAVANTAFVYVYKNGNFLVPNQDWSISPTTPNTIDLVDKDLASSDRIVVTYFSEVTGKSAYSYRMFKDMLGRFNYFRISGDATTALVSALELDDDTIYVNDASVLAEPNPDQRLPGVVMIGKERITYWIKDNDANTLTNIRRGTLGTGVKTTHAVGSKVTDMSEDHRVKYSDSNAVESFVSDGSTLSYVTTNLSIPDDSSATLEHAVLVYVGGRRVLSGFTVTNLSPVEVLFDTAPPAGYRISVVVKQGQIWYNQGATTAADGLGLQQSTKNEALFILDAPAIVEL